VARRRPRRTTGQPPPSAAGVVRRPVDPPPGSVGNSAEPWRWQHRCGCGAAPDGNDAGCGHGAGHPRFRPRTGVVSVALECIPGRSVAVTGPFSRPPSLLCCATETGADFGRAPGRNTSATAANPAFRGRHRGGGRQHRPLVSGWPGLRRRTAGTAAVPGVARSSAAARPLSPAPRRRCRAGIEDDTAVGLDFGGMMCLLPGGVVFRVPVAGGRIFLATAYAPGGAGLTGSCPRAPSFPLVGASRRPHRFRSAIVPGPRRSATAPRRGIASIRRRPASADRERRFGPPIAVRDRGATGRPAGRRRRRRGATCRR
jgi:hypothetical protein